MAGESDLQSDTSQTPASSFGKLRPKMLRFIAQEEDGCYLQGTHW